jgi:type I restriction enzyme S subunit
VEWSVKPVDEIASITTGDKDTQDREDSGDYPFFVRSQTVERIDSFSFDGEAVLTAGDGVGVGKVFHYCNGKFDFHQRVYCMHSFDRGLDGYLFFHYFRSHFMSRVSHFSAKNSVDSVRMAMIAKMLVPCPENTEQVRIASIFRQAQSLESHYVGASVKLRSLKTALMQDLLTGRMRVTPLLEMGAATQV